MSFYNSFEEIFSGDEKETYSYSYRHEIVD